MNKKHISYDDWLKVSPASNQTMRVTIHKNNCLYFNHVARDRLSQLSGIQLYEKDGIFAFGEGMYHITKGPRESKVYSKFFCDMLAAKFPGMREFLLTEGGMENMFIISPSEKADCAAGSKD